MRQSCWRRGAMRNWRPGMLHAGTAARAASERSAYGARVSVPGHKARHVPLQGFGFFGDLLSWFQRHNGWAGWGIFVGAGGSSSHIALRAAGVCRCLCLPLSAPQHCLTPSHVTITTTPHRHVHRHGGAVPAGCGAHPGRRLCVWLLARPAGGVGGRRGGPGARLSAGQVRGREVLELADLRGSLEQGQTAATSLCVLALWAGLHGLHVWQPLGTHRPTHPDPLLLPADTCSAIGWRAR